MLVGHIEQSDRVAVGSIVIEVGVDVPNPSLRVIEHAERFGLRNCTNCAVVPATRCR